MRVFVTGAGGQVGRALLDACAVRGFEAVGKGRSALDVTDANAVRSAIEQVRPDWVFHCAAATKVDRCESETAWARALNADAPGFVAEACASVGAGLVHYSTDFVFDGMKGQPYVETDAVAPLSVYGQTKLEGERVVERHGLDRWFVLRTQWVYGPQGRCFPAAILAKARAGEPLRVVDDQTGAPTTSLDLADASLDLVDACARGRAVSGCYHAAATGETTWYEFAREVLDRAGFEATEIAPISSAELALPARRPAHSTLDCGKLATVLGRSMPTWQVGLERWFRAEEHVRDEAARS
ncbi:MAG: dTDP-4-dehydrorhamnose reductase [Planctomycetes bacterium]|nr:dTDP-4-dehydrorhamnose reductase [Planctomycetota bacterium]MCB9918101.1 dTDP-4-dehydrorhamnose reductase [Planctomycetota bacterium]